MTRPAVPDGTGRPAERRHPLGTGLRLAIFAGMVAGAVLGYVITHRVFDLTCGRHCGSQPTVAGIVGGLLFLCGTAIVGVLLARSFGEWQMLRTDQRTAAPSEVEAAAGDGAAGAATPTEQGGQ